MSLPYLAIFFCFDRNCFYPRHFMAVAWTECTFSFLANCEQLRNQLSSNKYNNNPQVHSPVSRSIFFNNLFPIRFVAQFLRASHKQAVKETTGWVDPKHQVSLFCALISQKYVLISRLSTLKKNCRSVKVKMVLPFS